MAEVDFADYADNLARQLIDSYSRDGHIQLTTTLAPVSSASRHCSDWPLTSRPMARSIRIHQL